MAKLTDKQRKKIVAESVSGSSMTALAKKYGVSTATIHRVVHGDEKLKEKVEQKKAENTQSILAFMDSKKQTVCDLIDKLLAAMSDEDKIAATPLNQLATAMGIVIDKYTAGEVPKTADTAANNLFEAIEAIGEEDLNGIPEVQPPAEDDSGLVED